MSVLCILIDEGVQPLWDDGAVDKDCKWSSYIYQTYAVHIYL